MHAPADSALIVSDIMKSRRPTRTQYTVPPSTRDRRPRCIRNRHARRNDTTLEITASSRRLLPHVGLDMRSRIVTSNTLTDNVPSSLSMSHHLGIGRISIASEPLHGGMSTCQITIEAQVLT